MRILLGVLNFPYSSSDTGNARTTGAVALSLEERYGVMHHFLANHWDDLVARWGPAIARQLVLELNGEDVDLRSVFADANLEAKSLFTVFLNTREMDRLGVPGVPTQASLNDDRHKRPGEAPGVRPSFIKTGLYMASFQAFESDDDA